MAWIVKKLNGALMERLQQHWLRAQVYLPSRVMVEEEQLGLAQQVTDLGINS